MYYRWLNMRTILLAALFLSMDADITVFHFTGQKLGNSARRKQMYYLINNEPGNGSERKDYGETAFPAVRH